MSFFSWNKQMRWWHCCITMNVENLVWYWNWMENCWFEIDKKDLNLSMNDMRSVLFRLHFKHQNISLHIKYTHLSIIFCVEQRFYHSSYILMSFLWDGKINCNFTETAEATRKCQESKRDIFLSDFLNVYCG
jgi:hypothetical protein